jgi:hypothetical protein
MINQKYPLTGLGKVIQNWFRLYEYWSIVSIKRERNDGAGVFSQTAELGTPHSLLRNRRFSP